MKDLPKYCVFQRNIPIKNLIEIPLGSLDQMPLLRDITYRMKDFNKIAEAKKFIKENPMKFNFVFMRVKDAYGVNDDNELVFSSLGRSPDADIRIPMP